MTAATPVDNIVLVLEQAGYRRLPLPLEIASLKFNVTAALVGTGSLPDLIIVADTAYDTDDRTKNKIEGIARALDVVKSRRPLTVILAGPRPRPNVMDAISKICRVLPIGSATAEDADASLKNWLAVLLPLNLPQANEGIAEPMAELQAAVGDADPLATELIAASLRGRDRVEEVLHERISERLAAFDAGASS